MTEKDGIVSSDMRKLLLRVGGAAAVLYVLWQISATGTAILLLELPWVAGILLAGFTIGRLIVKYAVRGLTPGQKIVTSLAAGLPMLSLVVLGLGLAGMLHLRYLWMGIVGGLAVIGVIILYKTFHGREKEEYVFEAGKGWLILLVLLIPFLAMTLLGATIPAGVLWPAEGGGYDVLEYHLQVPKEWFDGGRIVFLEHNIYANFPSNAEMLYLLSMILKNDPYEAMYTSQLIHVSFTILFVAAVWVFCRPYGRKIAVFATVAAGTCPWLSYLGPLAYVEMGMLFTGVTAMGLVFRMMQRPEEETRPMRMAILVGVLLGFSAGFKYTALPMIAAPIILAGGMAMCRVYDEQAKKRKKFEICEKCDRLEQFGKHEKCDRFKSCEEFVKVNGFGIFLKARFKGVLAMVVMGAVCAAAIAPWLIRNLVWTGNPVFPMAYEKLGGRGWNEGLAARFKTGHSPREDEKPIRARLEKLYWAGLQNEISNDFIAEHYRRMGEYDKAKEVLNPPPIMDLPKFGFALLALPWWVFFTRRQKRGDWVMLMMFLIQTAVWLFMTHLQARFLVPWLIVLPFLVGRSAEAFGWRKFSPGMILMTGILLASTAMNFMETYKRYDHGAIRLAGAQQVFLKGEVPGTEYLKIVNENPSARVMLVGEARPFYIKGTAIYWTVFNRNDLAVAAEKLLHDVKNYLSKARPDYIFVNWDEIDRLSRTYGFDESIKPRLFNVLSKPGVYHVQRETKWGEMLERDGQKTPARVLYHVTWEDAEKKAKENQIEHRPVNIQRPTLRRENSRISRSHPTRTLISPKPPAIMGEGENPPEVKDEN